MIDSVTQKLMSYYYLLISVTSNNWQDLWQIDRCHPYSSMVCSEYNIDIKIYLSTGLLYLIFAVIEYLFVFVSNKLAILTTMCSFDIALPTLRT